MTNPARDPSAVSLFAFESHSIRVQVDANAEPWFVAKDVFDALDIHWTGRQALKGIPESWRMVSSLLTIQGDRDTLLISEPAVYKIAFRSRKAAAEAFTNRVAEIITTIRRTGRFEAQPSPMADHELNKIAWEICHNLWPEVRAALALLPPGSELKVLTGRDAAGRLFARPLVFGEAVLAPEETALLQQAYSALHAGLSVWGGIAQAHGLPFLPYPEELRWLEPRRPFPATGGPRR